ncbi:MAG TPA: FtsX-like permease family protein [Acidimicrobiales bacterium]|nr:FtsX-like permease family protein [Acidimicrobiales bacterium]
MSGRAGGGVPARRAMVRWSLRMFRREWRQHVLVTALLTVAVAGAVLGATAAYNMVPSRDAQFGRADHRLFVQVTDPAKLDPYLAAARRWFGTIDVVGHRAVAVPGRSDPVEVRTQQPGGPYGGPMLRLRRGSWPNGPGEVALTNDVAAGLGARVGGTVRLGRETARVVGLVENPGDLDDDFALAAPDAPGTPDSLTVLVRASDDRVRGFRPGVALGAEDVEPRGQTEKTAAAVGVLVVAAVAMLLVGLVAAAAFVVLAQRRRRQLGLLAAVGASRRHLRLAVVADGVATGAVAAALGTAVALVVWVLVGPAFEGAAGHRIGRLDVPWWLVAGGALLGVAAAAGAAWWPARAVSRVPVVDALSARPALPRPVRRSALAAGALLAGGALALGRGIDVAHDQANALLALAGTVAIVLAVPFLARVAVRVLGAAGRRAPVAARLALRDVARYPARSGAALAAASLGLGLAVAVVGVAAARHDDADQGNLSDRQLLFRIAGPDLGGKTVPERSPAEVERLGAAVGRVADRVGGSAVPLEVAIAPSESVRRDLQVLHPYAALGRRVGPNTLRFAGDVYVATPALLRELGLDPTAVAPTTYLLTTQRAPAHLVGGLKLAGQRGPLPAAAVRHVHLPDYSSAPRSLITAAGLRAAHLEAAPAGWLVTARRPLSGAEVSAARRAAADAGLTVEARDRQEGLASLRAAASAAGVLLALGILALAVGLIRGESRADLRVLAAAGAGGRTRRAITATTAGGLAVAAVVVGTVTAYVALVAGYWPDTGRLADVPVAELAVIAVGLPLAAAAAGWLLAGREPPGLGRPATE